MLHVQQYLYRTSISNTIKAFATQIASLITTFTARVTASSMQADLMFGQYCGSSNGTYCPVLYNSTAFINSVNAMISSCANNGTGCTHCTATCKSAIGSTKTLAGCCAAGNYALDVQWRIEYLGSLYRHYKRSCSAGYRHANCSICSFPDHVAVILSACNFIECYFVLVVSRTL